MIKKHKQENAEPEVKEEFIQEVLRISREHKEKYGFRTTNTKDLNNLFATENKDAKFLQNFETKSLKLEALGKTEKWKENKNL